MVATPDGTATEPKFPYRKQNRRSLGKSWVCICRRRSSSTLLIGLLPLLAGTAACRIRTDQGRGRTLWVGSAWSTWWLAGKARATEKAKRQICLPSRSEGSPSEGSLLAALPCGRWLPVHLPQVLQPSVHSRSVPWQWDAFGSATPQRRSSPLVALRSMSL